jgi:ABC-type branched-subunit amino acid transport system permease subunit
VLWGPLLGAGLLIPLSALLRNVSSIQSIDIIVYAVALIVLSLVLPQGVAGWFTACVRTARTRR